MTSFKVDGRTSCSPPTRTQLLGKVKPWQGRDAKGSRESIPAPNLQPLRWGRRSCPWLLKHVSHKRSWAHQLPDPCPFLSSNRLPVAPHIWLHVSLLLPHYVVFLSCPTPGPLPEDKCSPFPYIFFTFPDIQLPKWVFREDFPVLCWVR